MLNPHHTIWQFYNNCSTCRTRFKLLQDPKHLAAAAVQWRVFISLHRCFLCSVYVAWIYTFNSTVLMFSRLQCSLPWEILGSILTADMRLISHSMSGSHCRVVISESSVKILVPALQFERWLWFVLNQSGEARSCCFDPTSHYFSTTLKVCSVSEFVWRKCERQFWILNLISHPKYIK